MKDIHTHLKNIRSDAAECLVLSTLAPDGKREMFTRIAEHLNALAMDLESTTASATLNGGDTSQNENVVINATSHPGTTVRPRHYLRWAGIVVLGVVLSGTLLGWLTGGMAPNPTHERTELVPRDNPNATLTAFISTEQVQRKALLDRMTTIAGRLDNLDSKLDNLEKTNAERAKLQLITGSTNAETRPPQAEITPAPVVEKFVSTAENHVAVDETAAPAKQSDAVGPRGCTLFRSFDIKSGTYVTLDGRRRQCR